MEMTKEFYHLKQELDRIVNEYNTPGVDCIVYKDHEMIFRYFTGMSDLENEKKIKGDERYLIFSMTKMLTCTCALQLFEKGLYAMSDPVSKYLPEFEKMKISNEELDTKTGEKIASGEVTGEMSHNSDSGYAKNQITIKDLFTMGAGLDYNLTAPEIKKFLDQGKTSTRELVNAISKTVLGFEPGTRYRYSLCHDVLGALIEVWSGKKLSVYMRENLFEPLGMKNTFFGLPKDEKQLDKMAVRYIFKNGIPERLPLECVYNLSEEYESGGAGLTSCTEDYAIFLDTLACGGLCRNGVRILSPSTVDLMAMNHLQGKQCDDFDQMRPGYGYGLGVRTHVNQMKSGSLSPLGEFGWDGAAGGFSMVDKENRLSLTYFQEIHGWDIKIQTELRNALYEDLKKSK